MLGCASRLESPRLFLLLAHKAGSKLTLCPVAMTKSKQSRSTISGLDNYLLSLEIILNRFNLRIEVHTANKSYPARVR
jgi:hypothetical protein